VSKYEYAAIIKNGEVLWEHDPQRDGSGCTWCGAYAQVDKDNLCRECFDD
jgi:hypothetical protein